MINRSLNMSGISNLRISGSGFKNFETGEESESDKVSPATSSRD